MSALRRLPLNRRDDEGSRERKKKKRGKKRTEGQGRVWCFRFYGRLTHCLWGLIFALSPVPRFLPRASFSSRFLPRCSQPTCRGRIQTTDARDNAARPRCGTTRRCTMRQQSGAAPLSAGSRRLLAIISLSFPFSSSFSLFVSLFRAHRTLRSPMPPCRPRTPCWLSPPPVFPPTRDSSEGCNDRANRCGGENERDKSHGLDGETVARSLSVTDDAAAFCKEGKKRVPLCLLG